MLHLNVARHFGGKQTKLGNRVLIALIDGQKIFELEKIVRPAKILKFGILCINTINLSQLLSCNIAYNHKSGIH